MQEQEKIFQAFQNGAGICTDTRKINEGDIFFSLKGDNFDGNLYAEKALQLGAALAVVDSEEVAKNSKYILVEDALKALQQLANQYRKSLDIPVIALTGSNGKTTTKELMHAVLSTKYNTLATKGNLNNHIGVPLTLLSVKPEHQVAIIEMGANHVGEIAALCKIAEPSHGLITNIGKAHIGTFGGQENILRGKSELFEWLIKNNGTIWVNQNDFRLKNMAERMIKPLLYPGDYYNGSLVESDPYMYLRDERGKKIKTHLIGSYNYVNAIAALAVGKFFGVEPKAAAEALRNYIPENNRSQLIEIGTNKLIMDAYNANPSSMMLALENFVNMKSGLQKWVILGDMFELGEDEIEEHKIIGEYLQNQTVKRIYVGDLMQNASIADKEADYFQEKADLIEYLTENKPEKSIILVKGSRGMKLEDVLDVIKD